MYDLYIKKCRRHKNDTVEIKPRRSMEGEVVRWRGTNYGNSQNNIKKLWTLCEETHFIQSGRRYHQMFCNGLWTQHLSTLPGRYPINGWARAYWLARSFKNLLIRRMWTKCRDCYWNNFVPSLFILSDDLSRSEGVSDWVPIRTWSSGPVHLTVE